MKLLSFIYVFVFSVFYVELKALESGKCAQVDTKNDFQSRKMTGRWYEIAAAGRNNQRRCIQFLFDAAKYPTYPVHLLYIDENGKEQGVYLDKNIQTGRANGETGNGIHWFAVDTDYKNYAIFYFCVENPPLHGVGVYAKDLNNIKDEWIKIAAEKTKNTGFTYNDFKISNTTNCPDIQP